MIGAINRLLGRAGYRITKKRSVGGGAAFEAAYAAVQPLTMVDDTGALAAWRAVDYIARNGIEGDIVECGVWRGGIAILMAKRAAEVGLGRRVIHLFDTFEGMSPPTARDSDKHGNPASMLLAGTRRQDESSNVWAYASHEAVQRNLAAHGVDSRRVRTVVGRVEDTLPAAAPERIAICRLDTDWYESVAHELTHLYPRLSSGGVLLIDDYGYWQGCRQAVDEYFADCTPGPYFSLLASGSLAAVKP